MSSTYESLFASESVLALAPMQDVTDLPFWRLMTRYGGADLYFTEYFRVHSTSCLDKPILRSITENPTGRPVIAQMIGNDIPALIQTAKRLQEHEIVGIDLNLGCPAPVVYKKRAGGGLLREPQLVDRILGELREAITGGFSVKTRIGFDDPAVFEEMLKIFSKHSLDLLTVHGRTVKEMYRSEVHYDYIKNAVEAVACPVLANGNVYSAANAQHIRELTGAAGLMIGRGAIRNPWLFSQIRDHQRGNEIFQPTGRDVYDYIADLFETVRPPGLSDKVQVQKMKKYMNFIGDGLEASGEFLHRIRRVVNSEDFFSVCSEYLNHDDHLDLTPALVARDATSTLTC
jgi:tRNA-dihydrouridine synthase B